MWQSGRGIVPNGTLGAADGFRGRYSATLTVAGLAAGESVELTFAWDATARPGDHRFGARVDTSGAVLEMVESTNNHADAWTTVLVSDPYMGCPIC